MNSKVKIIAILTALCLALVLMFIYRNYSNDSYEQNPSSQSQTKAGNSLTTTTQSNGIESPDSGARKNGTPIESNQRATQENNFLDITKKNAIGENHQTPLELIDAYMTAWSGNDRDAVIALWNEIGKCPECLQRIRELLMNQGVPQGMLLELTYQIIELGDASMLPVFDYLLQPSVDLNTRVIITQQMMKDGRYMYVKKLFDILQEADFNGYEDYAYKHAWMISKLKNPEGIAPIFDIISGHSGPSASFAAHVRNVFVNTLLGMKHDEGMAIAIMDYYLSASETEQNKLWDIVSLHPDSLVALSIEAHENGATNQFSKYSQALSNVRSMDAVEGILKLSANIPGSSEYFIELIRGNVVKQNNSETLHKLEDYLRDPQRDRQTRIVAAEGLLAVKETQQARYILEKAVNASDYDDSDIIAYINARL